MIWKKLDDKHWLASGGVLADPEGFCWPNPYASVAYYSGSGYECHANFHTPQQFLDHQVHSSARLRRFVNPVKDHS